CFLRVDGRVITNGTCDIQISGDTRYWAMKGVAEVYMNHDLSGRPFYASIQKHGRRINYGRVEVVDAREEHICWGNKRLHMCFSQPYLACDPELVKAWTPNEENTHPRRPLPHLSVTDQGGRDLHSLLLFSSVVSREGKPAERPDSVTDPLRRAPMSQTM